MLLLFNCVLILIGPAQWVITVSFPEGHTLLLPVRPVLRTLWRGRHLSALSLPSYSPPQLLTSSYQTCDFKENDLRTRVCGGILGIEEWRLQCKGQEAFLPFWNLTAKAAAHLAYLWCLALFTPLPGSSSTRKLWKWRTSHICFRNESGSR